MAREQARLEAALLAEEMEEDHTELPRLVNFVNLPIDETDVLSGPTTSGWKRIVMEKEKEKREKMMEQEGAQMRGQSHIMRMSTLHTIMKPEEKHSPHAHILN